MSDSEIKALIVEDNPEHEQLLRNLLEASESPLFSVASAGSVAQACGRLKEGGVDIVLLDLTLSDSDGVQTFERIASVAKNIPIVVLSGIGDVSVAVQTVQLGAQDYLVKGHVDNNLLLRSIQYAIERKRAQGELRRAYEELELRVGERTSALRDANDALQREVEERKRAEAASLESNRQLVDALAELRTMQVEIVQRERLKALGQMADGIAHEFNNVLTPVLGYAEHLLNHPAVLANADSTRSFLEKIADAARSGAKAVARVRDFARTEAGERGPVPVEDLVQSSVNITEPLWRDEALKSGKTVFVSQNVDPVSDVIGNAGQLREVLMRLISNAAKAIEKRGMIVISVVQRGGGVAISVEDDGKGMPESERLQLLDPKRCVGQPSGGPRGFGLIHGIMERHGGRVEIECPGGKGTKVTIVLPAVPAAPPATAPTGPAPQLCKAARILVADDEPMVRDILCVYLQEDGHVVDVAVNGREALDRFREGDYDIVLSDRAMPEMNGDQLAVEVKKLKPNVPVILLTGFGDEMNARGDLPAGVDTVVAKPFTVAILREVLSQYVGVK